MTTSDSENGREKRGGNLPEKSNWSGNMLERNTFPPENIPLSDIISQLTKAQRERLISGYDLKNFARIFEDRETMTAVDSFLKNGMNVSETARTLYMHRNTLIYRINAMQKACNLNVCKFSDAVVFTLLYAIYARKKK